MQNLKELHNKKYKFIFFDIFDTIVSRMVTPEYTKKIWSNHLVKYYNLKIGMIKLYQLRSKIEFLLGKRNSEKGKDFEFSYNELIKEIYNELNLKLDYNEFYQTCSNLEIEIESSVQKVNSDIFEEIKKLKNEGKKIYCISDMYLSKKMIMKIFENLQILEYFDNIYVSSEYFINKKTGKLYEYVLNDINANAQDCIMIGDNYSSDYEIPSNYGIKSIHLDRTNIYNKYEEFSNLHNEKATFEEIKKLKNTTTDNFEHSIFTLYQFTEKLYFNLLKHGFDEVFFLSREGEFLKKLFDYYIEKINGKKIKSHYILVSRKSTYLPSLKKLCDEDFSALLNQYTYISLNEFLSSLNFTEEDKKLILNSYSSDCKDIIEKATLKQIEKEEMKNIIDKKYDEKIENLYESNILNYLKLNKDFIKLYEKNRKEQNNLFKKYIESYTTNKKICVVDIGWNGSIQNNIQNILGKDYLITGYLYGLVARNPENTFNKEGLIFTNCPKKTDNYDLFFENRTIYEILLGASHGSANRYVLNGKKVEVSTFSMNEEKNLYNNIISKIQDRMMNIYIKLVDSLANEFYDDILINKEINRIHYNMLFKPNKNQLQFFNKIYHYENFGVFEFTEFNLKRKLDIKYYIKENLKFFVRRDNFFYDTFWPILKLHNEKLYVPLSLYKLKKRIALKSKDVI